MGSGDFKSVKLSQTTVCNLIVERLLPTREKNLFMTKYLNFYWLRVHFVLSPTIRILEAKIAIQVLEYANNGRRTPEPKMYSTVLVTESCTGYDACAHGYPRLPVGRLGPPMTHPRFARSRLDHPYPPTPASRPYPYPPSTHFPCKNLARRRLFF